MFESSTRKIICSTGLAVAMLAIPAIGSAQSLSGVVGSLGSPIVSGGNLPVTGVAGVAVGNGVTQSQPLVAVQGSKAPLVGVGALSGSPTHGGSAATVSVLNTNRLVGVNLGSGATNGVNIANPTNRPVLSGIVK